MNVVYCRISQDRSGEGLGVERQLKDCRALAKKLGLTIDHVYTDNDASATTGKVRPQFEAMLRARPSTIITWHQDRLLRLSSDLEKVIALDVPVHAVTSGSLDLSTPAGRAVGRTVAAWSTYEGEQKALRLVAKNVQLAEAGVWQFSRRPYGYERVGKRVVVVETEAAIVREGFQRYLAGDSYYTIAADWNDRGVPTFGGAWSMSRVRSMLRNPAYAGRRLRKGEDVGAGDWEPLIDTATWNAYLSMRTRRKRAGDWSTQTKHLLSGIVTCAVCGSRMMARPDHGVQKYACTTNWCTTRKAADVDQYIEALVVAKLTDPAIVKGLTRQNDVAPLEAELAGLIERRDTVGALVVEGLLEKKAATAQLGPLKARIEKLTELIEASRADSPVQDLAAAEDVAARWSELSLPKKRQAIQTLMQIAIQRARPGRVPFDPDLVQITWV